MAKRSLPEREVTPEEHYLNRRQLLRKMGLAGLWATTGLYGCGHEKSFEPYEEPLSPSSTAPSSPPPTSTPGPVAGPDAAPTDSGVYPATLNPQFSAVDRPLTLESVAARYNNFFEFSQNKDDVAGAAWRLETRPWTVEVAGMVSRPRVYDVDELIHLMDLEERIYRFRCVEAWSMVVPWTGFPMSALLDAVEPLADAKFVQMTSFLSPTVAPVQWDNPGMPWPYSETLALEEAGNELTMLATGIYGHALPVQHGAPLRLVVPWKYGFKSIKSIVRIELVDQLPATFWNTLVPNEYGFSANVDPTEPHPRWLQDTEESIGTGEKRQTLPYNGYAEFVQHLYA